MQMDYTLVVSVYREFVRIIVLYIVFMHAFNCSLGYTLIAFCLGSPHLLQSGKSSLSKLFQRRYT